MSHPYTNRPFVPSRSRRHLPFEICEFLPYSNTEPNAASSDNLPWHLTDPLSYMHQASSLTSVASSRLSSAQNDYSYFPYSSHQHTPGSASIGPTRGMLSNNDNDHHHHAHQLGDSHPPCHIQYLGPNDNEATRPSAPFNRVTAAVTATASAPHHRHYRLESPSAASFTRHPPWFDDERDDSNGSISRSSRNNNHHTKRQRSSVVTTPTSHSSQSYHHHERKRSRQDTDDDGNEQINPSTTENVTQMQQQSQYRQSSHHHYQPYPRSHRPTQVQTPSMTHPSYIDHVSSLPQPFESRSQPILRNRNEHTSDLMNSNVHYGPLRRPTQPPPPPPPVPLPISSHLIYPNDHRQFIIESPTVTSVRRQPIPPPLPPPLPPSHTYTTQQNHQRGGITFDQGSQRPPLFHRASMTTHLHQRPSSSFLTDLLHRVIDAHAASYSDNHVHHYHPHHPPTASIDLIAYAWMSPGHDIFSLPAAFSIHFGDFFDLTIPDETPVVGLTDTELERLPTTIYSKSCTTIATDDKCAVCLSEYIIGEKVKRLRCKHYFHSECIDPWLKTSTRCPICRGEQTS